MSRISVVFSGGVSLCTYEAGVAAALIQAAYEDDAFEIDVAGGSSAGAVTAFLTAYTLSRGMNPVYLRKLIVDAADIRCMLTSDKRSVLTLDGMKDVFNRLMESEDVCMCRFGDEICVKNKSAEFCGMKICGGVKKRYPLLSIGITPVEGFIMDIKDDWSNDTYLAKSYHSSYLVDFRKFDDYNKEHLLDILLSSASYPVAFNPRNILMKRPEMKDLSGFYEFDSASFNFTDGGLSDDLPMRSVINSSEDIEYLALVVPCPENYRRFIDFTDRKGGFHATEGMLSFIGKVFGVLFFQSVSHDIKSFARTNCMLRRSHEIEESLCAEYERMSYDEKAAVDKFLSGFDKSGERTQDKIKSMLAYASNTERKIGMKLAFISPKDPEVDLEGEILFHFGGFFDTLMRKSDFDTGYMNGRSFIESLGIKMVPLFKKKKRRPKSMKLKGIIYLVVIKLILVSAGKARKNPVFAALYIATGVIYDVMYSGVRRK